MQFDNNIPLYIQIIERFKLDIAKNIYSSGEKLKSVRDFAIDFGVNANTVQKALSKLEEENLIYTERTVGKFITRDEQLLESLKKEIPTNITKLYIKEMKDILISNDQILNFIKENL